MSEYKLIESEVGYLIQTPEGKIIKTDEAIEEIFDFLKTLEKR